MLAFGVLAENGTPTVQIPSYFSKRAASSGHLRVHLKRADRPDRSTPVAREALQKISQLLKALAVTPTPIAVTSTSGSTPHQGLGPLYVIVCVEWLLTAETLRIAASGSRRCAR